MSKSKNDLALAVLRHIGVVDAAETADALDTALVIGVYDVRHPEWASRGYVDWPLNANAATTDIPEAAFQTVVNLIANEVLPNYGTSIPEEQRMAREQYLLVALRRIVAGTAESVSALRTKTQLSTAVLRKLGIIDPLATPSSKDAQIVWSAYDDKLAELTTKGLVFWPNTNATTAEIPKDVFLSLVNLMANHVRSWYGLEQKDSERLALEAQLLSELRQHVPGTELPVGGHMTKTQLSTAVLRRLKLIGANETPSTKDAASVWTAYDSRFQMLTARELTYWRNTSATAQEIPREVFADLVRILADDLAPEFGATLSAEMDESGSMVSPGTIGLRNLRRHMMRAPTGLATRSEYF